MYFSRDGQSLYAEDETRISDPAEIEEARAEKARIESSLRPSNAAQLALSISTAVESYIKPPWTHVRLKRGVSTFRRRWPSRLMRECQ